MVTMNKLPVYVGIDVAYAKRKRLPICVGKRNGAALDVLPLRDSFPKPPAGRGNIAALSEVECKTFAKAVAVWLRKLEDEKGLDIKRIAIDAPRNHAVGHRRCAECAMDELGINCFTTPTKAEFDEKINKTRTHLDAGGEEAKMPNANQLWMLVGFALFRALEKTYDCIEVFPQAIVRAIGCKGEHKSTAAGREEQVKRFAKASGKRPSEVTASLSTMGFASQHDRLDACLAAWVASLPPNMLIACGRPPDDVIWMPDKTRFANLAEDS